MIILIITLSMLLIMEIVIAVLCLIGKAYISFGVIAICLVITVPMLIGASSMQKSDDEIIKGYMNGKYKVEIKGTYQDSLFMPSDTIITLK
jgi:hypothetical protein